MADHFQLRLVDSRMLAPAVRHLVFERVDGQPVALQPGQFLQVHFHYDDGTATKRSYSVATIGDGHSPVRRIEIEVERAIACFERGAAGGPDVPVIRANGPANGYRMRAGITRRVRFHDLRHTACSRLARKVPNVIELAAITGHSNVGMLKRYYHVSPDYLAEKIA